jgi:hypothetical protein
MSLPGGLIGRDGVVDRTYTWKPLNGAAEWDFANAAAMPSRAEAVSRALEAALERVGGEAASRARVDALSVQDRRFLMIELARRLGLSASWSSHYCATCGQPFEFPFDLADLPVEPAKAVIATATVAGRTLTLRAPTGGDQMRAAAVADDESAPRLLATLCLTPGDAPPALSEADRETIEAALDDVLPQIPWAVTAPCPDCRAQNVIAIDVCAWLAHMAAGPLYDVHEIASAYGWSERDILALPRERRQAYLELIRGEVIA